MRKVQRDKQPRPLLAVCTLCAPASVGQRHSRKWMDTRHSLRCALKSLRRTALQSSSYGRGVHLVQNAEQFIGRTSTPLSRFHIDIMQVIFELHVTHPTLQCSKDEQDQDRLPFCKWIRISHRRGSHMGRNSPMLRQAQVRCCIAGSERPWRRA